MDEPLNIISAIKKPLRQRVKAQSRRFRQNVFQRAGHKCEVCSYHIADILNIHHIKPIGKDGETDIFNCVLLCPNCHGLVHVSTRILTKGMSMDSCVWALTEAGVSQKQAEALALLATERAMVTYAGEIVERQANPTPTLTGARPAKPLEDFINDIASVFDDVGEKKNGDSVTADP